MEDKWATAKPLTAAEPASGFMVVLWVKIFFRNTANQSVFNI